MKDKDAGLELDYWKDYRIIEACRTAEEAKAIIDKVRVK